MAIGVEIILQSTEFEKSYKDMKHHVQNWNLSPQQRKYPAVHNQALIACLKSFCKRDRGNPLMGSVCSRGMASEKLKPIRVFVSPPRVSISIGPVSNCFRTIISSHWISICSRLQVSLPKSWIMKHGRIPHFRRYSPTLFISSESFRKRH
jgi:hypothetical protein